MYKVEIIPQEIRAYGNIISPKTASDFVGKYNEIYVDENGYFVLSFGGVMLKASATVNNSIKGLTTSLTVIVSSRDGNVPIQGLTVNCMVDDTPLTDETTDLDGKCVFNWTPDALGDSLISLTIPAQGVYATLTQSKTITVGLLLGFHEIMTDLSLEDDEVYIASFEQQIENRSQLAPFVKDVWVADGGEPITDKYGIVHICQKGDVVVELDELEQFEEYSNVLFEGDVEALTGAVYDMELTEDYELVLSCLERSDIVPDVPPASFD